MIILWITNVELPVIAKQRGKQTFVGGWLDQASLLLAKSENIELHILGMSEDYDEIYLNKIGYAGFSPKKVKQSLRTTIKKVNPDIIHIWGSEYLHSYEAVSILKNMELLDRTIVSIQGLVSIYVKHYFAGIPEKIKKKKTIYELVRRKSLVRLYQEMCKQGIREKKIFEIAKHCIGRTDWDRACVKQINPMINYCKCNEILRAAFYEEYWSYEKCEKYTISFSQTHYPIKGLHYMLEALVIIKKKYPNVKLRVLGDNPQEIKDLKQRIKISTYQKYLIKLINMYDLKDNVEWVGFCDEKQMVQHYLGSNLFVCASSIENSSNSIGEAMLLGVPVVASDVGGIKSLLKHEQEGLLYQADAAYMLADCALRIFENAEFAIKLGKAARERALTTHSAYNNTIELIKIYSDIISNDLR